MDRLDCTDEKWVLLQIRKRANLALGFSTLSKEVIEAAGSSPAEHEEFNSPIKSRSKEGH